MSINARWKALAACAALALAVTACGEDKTTDDTKDPVGNGGDGGGNGTAGSTGNSNGNSNSGSTDGDGGFMPTPRPPLEPGVAGKECATDEDCGEGGECRDPLSGGSFAGYTLGASGPTGGYCSRSCTEDLDCGEGGFCFGTGRRGGECRRACTASADCERDNYECAKLNRPLTDDDGADVPVPQSCQPLRTPVAFTDQVATACTDDAMCGANAACRMGGQFPEGYCSGSCNTDSDCGAEGLCLLRQYGAGGVCYEACTVDTDCKRDAANYGCVDTNNGTGIKACLFKMDPLPDGIVGTACTDDAMCGNGVCAERVGVEQVPTPGGYCSATGCEDDAQCGAGGSCVPSEFGTRCYKTCAADADCRAGYACTSRGTADKMVNVCFPIAVAGDAGP